MATENQRKVVTAIAEKVRKGEKISVSKEMRKAGYSEHTSRQPGKLTGSKGWEELMEQYFPDEDLAKAIKDLIKHKDWRARDAGVGKALKLKNKYPPEQIKVDLSRKGIQEMADSELDQEIRRIEKELKSRNA